MPGTKDAHRLAAHIDLIAKRYEVTIMWDGRDKAWPSAKIVSLRPVASQITYFIALHEIGHCVTYASDQSKADREALAWDWAFKNSIITPTPATRARCAKYFSSYVQRGIIDNISEQHEPTFMAVARLMNIDVQETANRIEEARAHRQRKRTEYKVVNQVLRHVYQVGEILKFADDINPAYMRGVKVRVVEKARKKLVVEILEYTGSDRFRQGMRVRINPSGLERV